MRTTPRTRPTPKTGRRRLGDQRGQTLAEVAIVLPLLLMLMIGTLQLGFVLYQAHLTRKVSREAGSLLSRQVTLQATATAMEGAIAAIPHLGSFSANATLILSVVQIGPPGSTNAGVPIITRRWTAGGLGGASVIGNPAQSAFGAAPNYPALDPANNTALRTSPLPNGLTITPAESLFVAELYLDRRDISNWIFGGAFPDPLYANVLF